MRVYEDILTEWIDGNVEISYTDYDKSGNIHQTGSKVFSRQKNIKTYAIFESKNLHRYAYKGSIKVSKRNNDNNVKNLIIKSKDLINKYNLDITKNIKISFVDYGFSEQPYAGLLYIDEYTMDAEIDE